MPWSYIISVSKYRWLSARLQYFQCVNSGDWYGFLYFLFYVLQTLCASVNMAITWQYRVQKQVIMTAYRYGHVWVKPFQPTALLLVLAYDISHLTKNHPTLGGVDCNHYYVWIPAYWFLFYLKSNNNISKHGDYWVLKLSPSKRLMGNLKPLNMPWYSNKFITKHSKMITKESEFIFHV